MPSLGGTRNTPCQPGQWTALWDAPSFGFSYLWSDRDVRIRWRRWSTGIPFYSEGSSFIRAGQNNEVVSGGPSAYTKFEVNPSSFAVMRST
jgi:hypothetical protein